MKHNTQLCIMAARKGSTRLPGKNKRPLAGRPLYAHTVDAAVSSNLFDRILFTTDDEEILSGLDAWPEVTAIARPKALADAQTTMMEVIRHLLTAELADCVTSTITLLTPCHPFRTAQHLQEAHSLFNELKAQSVVSVTPYHCPPQFALTLDRGFIERSFSGPVRGGDATRTFHPNGAITIITAKDFLRCDNFYPPQTAAYVMDLPGALDIDTAEDFTLAQALSHLLCDQEAHV